MLSESKEFEPLAADELVAATERIKVRGNIYERDKSY
jgi:hypothetical protein